MEDQHSPTNATNGLPRSESIAPPISQRLDQDCTNPTKGGASFPERLRWGRNASWIWKTMILACALLPSFHQQCGILTHLSLLTIHPTKIDDRNLMKRR